MNEQISEPQSVFNPMKSGTSAESSRDPMRIMIEIAESDKLSDADKTALINYAQTRFTNRRRIAYIALWGIILSLILLFIAAFIDGFGTCPPEQQCNSILEAIGESQTLFAWIEGFLAAIVAAYYGVSAWRPAS